MTAARFEQRIRGVSRGFRDRLFASGRTDGKMAQAGSGAFVSGDDRFVGDGLVGVAVEPANHFEKPS